MWPVYVTCICDLYMWPVYFYLYLWPVYALLPDTSELSKQALSCALLARMISKLQIPLNLVSLQIKPWTVLIHEPRSLSHFPVASDAHCPCFIMPLTRIGHDSGVGVGSELWDRVCMCNCFERSKDTKSIDHKHQRERERVAMFWPHYEKRETRTCVDNWQDLQKYGQRKTAREGFLTAVCHGTKVCVSSIVNWFMLL